MAVLQRDRGLVGQGLEQPEVVLAEHRALGQAVADDQRADQLRLAAKGADHVLRHAPIRVARLLEERRRRVGRDAGGSGPPRSPGPGPSRRPRVRARSGCGARPLRRSVGTGRPPRARRGTSSARGSAATPGSNRSRGSAAGSATTGTGAPGARASRAPRRTPDTPGRPSTTGRISSQSMAGLNHSAATARSARLVFASATISPNWIISGSFRNCGAPPESVMTVAIVIELMIVDADVAANAASHSRKAGIPSRIDERRHDAVRDDRDQSEVREVERHLDRALPGGEAASPRPSPSGRPGCSRAARGRTGRPRPGTRSGRTSGSRGGSGPRRPSSSAAANAMASSGHGMWIGASRRGKAVEPRDIDRDRHEDQGHRQAPDAHDGRDRAPVRLQPSCGRSVAQALRKSRPQVRRPTSVRQPPDPSRQKMPPPLGVVAGGIVMTRTVVPPESPFAAHQDVLAPAWDYRRLVGRSADAVSRPLVGCIRPVPNPVELPPLMAATDRHRPPAAPSSTRSGPTTWSARIRAPRPCSPWTCTSSTRSPRRRHSRGFASAASRSAGRRRPSRPRTTPSRRRRGTSRCWTWRPPPRSPGSRRTAASSGCRCTGSGRRPRGSSMSSARRWASPSRA